MLARLLLVAIVFFSISNFNPAVLGATEEGGLQQVVVLALWLGLILLTFTQPPAMSVAASAGALLLATIYVYAFVSAGWSSDPASSLAKAAVLLFTTFGAWRLHTVVTMEEFLDCTLAGLTALAAISVALVLFVPSIGILNTWQHAGQWAGIFVTKQNLGTACALLVLLALVRFIHTRRRITLVALALGLACVVGSGSRGGAAIAVTAVIGILAARRFRAAATLVAMMPLLTLLMGVLAITYLVATGYPYFLVGDTQVNLTERTLIWQYALDSSSGQRIFGTGTNGFWSNPDYYFEFLRQHEWVLDNFHSGFVAVMVELGLVGMALLTGVTILVCRALRLSFARAAVDPKFAYPAECAAGFVVLFFTINLTETFLLRSTNFLQSMFTFLMLGLFALPAGAAGRLPSRVGWLSQTARSSDHEGLPPGGPADAAAPAQVGWLGGKPGTPAAVP